MHAETLVWRVGRVKGRLRFFAAWRSAPLTRPTRQYARAGLDATFSAFNPADLAAANPVLIFASFPRRHFLDFVRYLFCPAEFMHEDGGLRNYNRSCWVSLPDPDERRAPGPQSLVGNNLFPLS
jgi:hypothetical protein